MSDLISRQAAIDKVKEKMLTMKPDDATNEQKDQEPAAKEKCLSVLPWILADILLFIIPTAILCKDLQKVLVIAFAILGVCTVYTFIACRGWEDD